MATARQMIDWATRQLGYREGPRNNESKYGAHTGYNFQPWCGSFLKTGFDELGMPEPSSVYTPAGAASYQRLGRWVSRGSAVQPGDVVFFDWQGGQRASGVDHVGLVVEVRPDTTVVTIEGNTSSGEAGSQSDGGGVYRRIRPRGVIAGFGRPSYDKEPDVDLFAVRRWTAGQLASSVAALPDLPLRGQTENETNLYTLVLQRALNVVMSARLPENGRYDQATAKAVVRYQEFWNKAKPGAIKDFPGAAHAGTRFMLTLQLQQIRDGQA